MKSFEHTTDNPEQVIEEEIAALSGRLEELKAQLANIGQPLGQARINQHRPFEIILFKNAAVSVEALENQRQDIQKVLAEAVARTKVSDKNMRAYQVCAGEVRWRNGLLEQLWHIKYLGTDWCCRENIRNGS